MPNIEEIVQAELAQPFPHGASVLADHIRAQFGDNLCAILFYGSCLRTGDDQHSLLDFYVIVDSYRAYTGPLLATINHLLPPNVFYLQVTEGDLTYRTKYAVVSRRQFCEHMSPQTFQTYFWSRFAQPCALVYCRDDQVSIDLHAAIRQAILTYVDQTLPLAPPRFTSPQFWTHAFSASYGTELRSEQSGVAEQLYLNAPQRYDQVLPAALAELSHPRQVHSHPKPIQYSVQIDDVARRKAARHWRLRKWLGKTLFLIRLLRNGLTFDGGPEYVLWKIERHSGIAADYSWKNARFRIPALLREAWRLYRKGAFR